MMEAAKHPVWIGIKVLLAALVAPFLYTAVYNLMPFYAWFWPVAIGMVVAGTLAIASPQWRPAALGFMLGSAIYAAFILWLFASLGTA